MKKDSQSKKELSDILNQISSGYRLLADGYQALSDYYKSQEQPKEKTKPSKEPRKSKSSKKSTSLEQSVEVHKVPIDLTIFQDPNFSIDSRGIAGLTMQSRTKVSQNVYHYRKASPKQREEVDSQNIGKRKNEPTKLRVETWRKVDAAFDRLYRERVLGESADSNSKSPRRIHANKSSAIPETLADLTLDTLVSPKAVAVQAGVLATFRYQLNQYKTQNPDFARRWESESEGNRKSFRVPLRLLLEGASCLHEYYGQFVDLSELGMSDKQSATDKETPKSKLSKTQKTKSSKPENQQKTKKLEPAKPRKPRPLETLLGETHNTATRREIAESAGLSYKDFSGMMKDACAHDHGLEQAFTRYVVDTKSSSGREKPVWVFENVLIKYGIVKTGTLRADPLSQYTLHQASEAVDVPQDNLEEQLAIFKGEYKGKIPGWAINLALGRDIYALDVHVPKFLSTKKRTFLTQDLNIIIDLCKVNTYKVDMAPVEVSIGKSKRKIELNRVAYAMSKRQQNCKPIPCRPGNADITYLNNQ
ncbi:hypothetical protein KY337_03600 [Candidatus Woesearchaeota archaeon]|nr:hypothetical protein [Candidatus Woesearchaeota archaeon]